MFVHKKNKMQFILFPFWMAREGSLIIIKCQQYLSMIFYYCHVGKTFHYMEENRTSLMLRHYNISYMIRSISHLFVHVNWKACLIMCKQILACWSPKPLHPPMLEKQSYYQDNQSSSRTNIDMLEAFISFKHCPIY